MCDPSKVTGSCANCGQKNIPGSGFVKSDLVRFLAVESGVRANEFVDARAEQRKSEVTEVAGPTLQCRQCVLGARDVRDTNGGFQWGTQKEIVFPTRPFGMTPSKDRFLEYVVMKVDNNESKPAHGMGIRCGWRVVEVAGCDMRGEPVEEVQKTFKDAKLPLTVLFDVPEEEWLHCMICELSFPRSRLSSSMECASCGEGPSTSVPEVDAEALMDDWEDDTDE